MLKLTLILCVAIYACLVIFSDPAIAPIEADPEPVTEAEVPEMDTALREVDGRRVLTTANGEVLQISTVITASRDEAVARPTPDAGAANGGDAPEAEEPITAPVATADAAPVGTALPVVEVTGTRVNLRSGPSTETDILDALVQGTRAEVLASLADGWAQIRVIETGIEGYMADRFLATVN